MYPSSARELRRLTPHTGEFLGRVHCEALGKGGRAVEHLLAT